MDNINRKVDNKTAKDNNKTNTLVAYMSIL